jgi:hypothetical protein
VFQHFIVQEVWRCCKGKIMNSYIHEVITTIGCVENTWRQIGQSRNSEKSIFGRVESRDLDSFED